jgi:hypothetical protein
MTEPEQNANSEARVVAGKLHRVRRTLAKTFVQEPPAPPEPVRRPARVALMLALAHKIQDAIDRGVVRDHVDAAQRLGLTSGRVTQLLDLTLLAPDIQERLLFSESIDGVESISERQFRRIIRFSGWGEQREKWRRIS